MPATTLVPASAESLPHVAAFLSSGFHAGPDDHFAKEKYLRWQYLDWPSGPGERAYNCVADERIIAHAGILHTKFLIPAKSADSFPVVSTLHSWLSLPKSGPAGALLLLQSFSHSTIQYAFSFSPAAGAVLKASGYALRQVVPVFRRVFNPARWADVYRGEPRKKVLAFRIQETALALTRLIRPAPRPMELERVTRFDARAEAVAADASRQVILTERNPEFLNHLLRHPFGETCGYYFRDDGKTVGLALLHFNRRGGLLRAKILDCLLGNAPDALSCARALAALEKELKARQADVAFGMAGTPWLEAGFRRVGYVRRGRNQLMIRDPQGQLPPQVPVHLALVDSDLAFNN